MSANALEARRLRWGGWPTLVVQRTAQESKIFVVVFRRRELCICPRHGVSETGMKRWRFKLPIPFFHVRGRRARKAECRRPTGTFGPWERWRDGFWERGESNQDLKRRTVPWSVKGTTAPHVSLIIFCSSKYKQQPTQVSTRCCVFCCSRSINLYRIHYPIFPVIFQWILD